MDGTSCNRRRRAALLLSLLLCGAPLGAEAQEFVCSPIARGDTVARLALRLTGSSRATYSDAFQIRDPARGMFVPKSQYRRPLSTDWEACVASERVDAPLAEPPTPAPSLSPAIATAAPAITSAPLTDDATSGAAAPATGSTSAVVIGAIGSAVAAMLVFCVAAGVLLAPRPVPAALRRAGEDFVNAFAQPLVDSSSAAPPIRTRLRFIRQGQLEISIAPGAGRRYPNLVDHKRNVEYDVRRVMRIVGAHVVVSDRLRASGKWVRVRIRLAHQEQAGGR